MKFSLTSVLLLMVLLAHEALSCKKHKEPTILCLSAPAAPCLPAAAPYLPPAAPCLPAAAPCVAPAALDYSCLLQALTAALPAALAQCSHCGLTHPPCGHPCY